MSVLVPCAKCGSTERYEKRPGRTLGQCKPCSKAASVVAYAADPEAAKAAARAWYHANKDRASATRLAWQRANPGVVQAINKKWVEANPSRARAVHRKSMKKSWAGYLLTAARSVSRARGHAPPTITRAWIEKRYHDQPLCPFTGIRLVSADQDDWFGLRCPWTPSLDRIDASIGYTPDNVNLTSLFWNMFRGLLPTDVALMHLQSAAQSILSVRSV